MREAGSAHLATVADTEAFGRQLADDLRAGDVVILSGALGAGKTALTRGIGAGLGVRGRVSSPSFIIAREHRAGDRGIAMVHVDAYRLLDSTDLSGELDALDLETELTDAVVVVEWGADVAGRLANRYLLVELDRSADDEIRTARWEWVTSG